MRRRRHDDVHFPLQGKGRRANASQRDVSPARGVLVARDPEAPRTCPRCGAPAEEIDAENSCTITDDEPCPGAFMFH